MKTLKLITLSLAALLAVEANAGWLTNMRFKKEQPVENVDWAGKAYNVGANAVASIVASRIGSATANVGSYVGSYGKTLFNGTVDLAVAHPRIAATTATTAAVIYAGYKAWQYKKAAKNSEKTTENVTQQQPSRVTRVWNMAKVICYMPVSATIAAKNMVAHLFAGKPVDNTTTQVVDNIVNTVDNATVQTTEQGVKTIKTIPVPTTQEVETPLEKAQRERRYLVSTGQVQS